MSDPGVLQLIAVVIGGVIAIAGGMISTLVVEGRRRRHDSAQLAMAFKGEITAIVQHIEERAYRDRIAEVIAQIESTRRPFFMPLRVRFKYDRVYEANSDKLGLLERPLPERIPLFYTRMNSALDDFMNLAEGAYSGLDTPTLVRVYQDLHAILGLSVQLGKEVVREIDLRYPTA